MISCLLAFNKNDTNRFVSGTYHLPNSKSKHFKDIKIPYSKISLSHGK